MIITRWVRAATVAAGLLVFPVAGQAQQASPAAMALAKEYLTIKGGIELLDPVIFGVIEQARQTFLRANPLVGKDLNEVAAAMQKDYAPRLEEVRGMLYRSYAARFTEVELKEMIAFFKTPIGQKMLKEEPAVIDQAVRSAEDYGEKFTAEVIGRMRGDMKKRGHDL